MIRSIKNKTPEIHFANVMYRWRSVKKDGIVKVWLSTVYFKKSYAIKLTTDLDFNKISDYEYDVTGNITGFHKIELTVTDKQNNKTITSNSLLLIVI